MGLLLCLLQKLLKPRDVVIQPFALLLGARPPEAGHALRKAGPFRFRECFGWGKCLQRPGLCRRFQQTFPLELCVQLRQVRPAERDLLPDAL